MDTSNTNVVDAAVLEPQKSQSKAGKYLSFILGDEEYGIEILAVREIITVIEITTVPQVPHYVKGVINLRGSVIPVIDLRLKFDMPEKEYDKETCTIVVKLGNHFMGIIVDTVSEVLDIHDEQMDNPPSFGSSVDTDFILGMGKIKEKVVILLDIEKVLQNDRLAELQASVEGLDVDVTEEKENV